MPFPSAGSAHDATRGRGGVIAVCVLLSTLLWLAFSLGRPTTVTLDLPARIVNLPTSEALNVPAPDTIEYVVSGDAISILPIYYNRPTVEIDAALDEIDFETGGAAFPVDVRVEAASPRRYVPQREERTSVVVPIEFRGSVDIPPTHAFVTAPRLEPDSLRISGARSIVENVRSWPTRRLEIADARDSLNVTVVLSDTLSSIVSRSRSEARLVADIAEFTRGDREIDVRLTGSSTARPVATLDPNRISVSFRVRVEDYNELMFSPDFYAVVPYDAIRGDTTGRVTPRLNFPSGVLVRDAVMTPPTLRYFNFLYDQ